VPGRGKRPVRDGTCAVSLSAPGAAAGGFLPKTCRSPVSPVPKGCGSVPKENRNRADGRHTRDVADERGRTSARLWPSPDIYDLITDQCAAHASA
jgi:hypothetical protein